MDRPSETADAMWNGSLTPSAAITSSTWRTEAFRAWSVTMPLPPGRSLTPELLLGTWNSGAFLSSDFGTPRACAKST